MQQGEGNHGVTREQGVRKESDPTEQLDKVSRRVGRRLWWANGIPEITLALMYYALVAIVALDGTWLAWPARILAIGAAFWVPSMLYERLLVGMGAGALRVEREPHWLSAGIAVSIVVALAVFVWGTNVVPDTGALFGVLGLGLPLAVPFLLLHGYTGQERHLVLAGLIGVVAYAFGAVPDSLEWLAVVLPGVALAGIGAWGLLSLRSRLGVSPSLAELQASLGSDDADLRFGAAEFLAGYGEPRVIPDLVRAASDENPDVRLMARIALWRVWGPDGETRFHWHLEDSGVLWLKDEHIDDEVLAGVESDREAAALNAVDYRAEVRQALTNALSADPAVFDALAHLAEEEPDTDDDLGPGQEAALRLLLGSERPEGIALVLQRLASIDSEAWRGVSAAFEMATAATVEPLLALAAAPDERTAGRAIDALLMLIPELEDAGEDVAALTPRMLERALQLSHATDIDTQRSALLALGLVGGDEAASRLAEVCELGEPESMGPALFALSEVDVELARGFARAAVDYVSFEVRDAVVEVVDRSDWAEGARMLAQRVDGWAKSADDEADIEVVERAHDVVHRLGGYATPVASDRK